MYFCFVSRQGLLLNLIFFLSDCSGCDVGLRRSHGIQETWARRDNAEVGGRRFYLSLLLLHHSAKMKPLWKKLLLPLRHDQRSSSSALLRSYQTVIWVRNLTPWLPQWLPISLQRRIGSPTGTREGTNLGNLVRPQLPSQVLTTSGRRCHPRRHSFVSLPPILAKFIQVPMAHMERELGCGKACAT